jgi:magnesium chelatase subunit D
VRLPRLAHWAARLLAVEPPALGGVRLRAPAGAARDAWLAELREACGAGVAWRRLPPSIGDGRLIGGLDLVATLAAGRLVAQRGLLAECDGGVVIVPMAERLAPRVAAALAAALDRGEVVVEREGLAQRDAARFAVVALDEAQPEDTAVAPALVERLALELALEALVPNDEPAPADDAWPAPPRPAEIAAARGAWRHVAVPDTLLATLCRSCAALGVDSMRRAGLALSALRMVAALRGRDLAADDDLGLVIALVVLPHATRLPNAEPDPEAAEAESPSDPPAADAAQPPAQSAKVTDAEAPATEGAETETEIAVQAALARLPPALLASLAGTVAAARLRQAREGRSGALAASRLRGRPLGARPGDPRRGDRLSLVDTLRSAVPWQRLRQAEARAHSRDTQAPSASAPTRLQLRREDLRVMRRAQRRASTTVFVIDASGSAALHRLAEAKGAVELLLAESYARRDEVAVIGFRGRTAELLLPPTRSLLRAKRALAGLPGGGGTPLAAALQAAAALAEQVARRGATPSVVLLSDGRANVPLMPAAAASAPSPAAPSAAALSRAQAEADALAAARRLALGPARRLVIDTSPQPGPAAQRLAAAMQAAYLPLPHARAEAVSAAARTLRA